MEDIKKRIKIEESIKKLFEKNNQEFFSYAWRENISNFLSNENRYTCLLEWINERIDIEMAIINCFNPADKDETFSIGNMKDYLKSCETVAMLENAKAIILDEKCTTKMRENWEYTICKLFNIVYNKELGFVPNQKGGK